jgi:hypothetical protein
LSNPEVLATCIVPQIEAYLAINTSTRILVLHYPFNHLATIIALRKIIGQDVLKIAGIMDSTSSDPPSAVSRPRTPKANPLSDKSTSIRSSVAHSHSGDSSPRKTFVTSQVSSNNHQSKKSEVSFSKANYLLPSIATNAEISSFLSGIWTSLVEISAFYNPEPEPKPTIFEKPPLPPTPATSTFQRDPPHSPASLRHGSTSRESKIARLTGSSIPGSTPSRTSNGYKSHKHAPSIASTVRTTNSERVRREDTRIEKEWENFYIGEEDSEDDDYDRMVMGRSMARIVPEVKVVTSEGKMPKRSTKKALKWLGLA